MSASTYSQAVQQAVVVTQPAMKYSKVATKLALFKEDGTPANLNGPAASVSANGELVTLTW